MSPGSSRRFLAGPLAVAGLLSVLYLVTAPLSADHAAQLFRTELFEQAGPVLWNNYWFGGHYLPTYSAVAPALGAWIGFRLMGVAAVLGTVALFSAVVHRRWGDRALAGALWFSAAATVSLFSGRLTFALGVVLAMAAVFAAQRGWRPFSILLAFSVALASPVAALFLACCGAAHWIDSLLSRSTDRRGLELAVASFFTATVIALLFPGGGDEPYVWTSFVPAVALTLAAAALIPARERLVRIGLLLYALSLAAAFLLDTPMGGNANRLGVLLVGSLFLCTSWPLASPGWNLRTVSVAALLPLLALWQFYPVVRDLELVRGEPAVAASFYGPLKRALAPRLERRPARIEVLPVASHWESARLAPGVPLARGWERQTDRRLNPLFYRDRLGAGHYRRWLNSLAVGYVAVPQDTELDYAAESEAELIASGTAFLRELAPVPGWRIYRVLRARPIVQPPGRITGLSTDGFSLFAPRAGSYGVRIRWTSYWRIVAGTGCVSERRGGWTRVSTDRPGEIRVRAEFTLGARFAGVPHCRP